MKHAAICGPRRLETRGISVTARPTDRKGGHAEELAEVETAVSRAALLMRRSLNKAA
jgi:hypothetical protein